MINLREILSRGKEKPIIAESLKQFAGMVGNGLITAETRIDYAEPNDNWPGRTRKVTISNVLESQNGKRIVFKPSQYTETIGSRSLFGQSLREEEKLRELGEALHNIGAELMKIKPDAKIVFKGEKPKEVIVFPN